MQKSAEHPAACVFGGLWITDGGLLNAMVEIQDSRALERPELPMHEHKEARPKLVCAAPALTSRPSDQKYPPHKVVRLTSLRHKAHGVSTQTWNICKQVGSETRHIDHGGMP